MTAIELTAQLSILTQGLLYISESENPLEVLPWTVKEEADLLQQIAAFTPQPEDALQRPHPADFFAAIQKMVNPEDEAMTAYAKRYEALYSFLTQNTDRIQVIKAGQIQVHVFIAGFAADGSGGIVLHTIAIET